ncbi:MAG: hypothetical protein HY204_03950 [Nitrospirae bacterium]|nr:hypothetical protein [Nitrospirota bacterium]
MAGKKVWVTWMPTGKSAPRPDAILSALGTVGMELEGAPWIDDLQKMAWYELGSLLVEAARVDLWLVAGTRDDFQSLQNRHALSLVTAMVREGRGSGFPIFFLGLDHAPEPESMPTLLRDLRFLSAADSNWPAKIATAFLKPVRGAPWDFRINAVGHPIIGQWFEIGPREGEWAGVMFGVSGDGKITHHMVGPKGQMPEKSVLEYPTEGIRAEVRGVEFTAWSVQNRIGPQDSYYVKVEGHPRTLLFGGHPGTDQAEVTVLKLS